jgi:hypothetical protein
MGQTIEDLLKSMLTFKPEPGQKSDFIKGTLENSVETWRRIGEKDEFSELEFKTEQERRDFLAEWIENNPYSNI